MARISQRLDRGLKTTALRTLRFNLRSKRLFTKRRDCLFITCFPKSGSTFLVAALAEVTGYLRFFLGQNHLSEQDLYLPNLIDAYNMNVVCHQHTRANALNLELMDDFGIRPVVLVRNVFDCLVSLRDHLENESRQTPVFNASEGFFEKPREEQFDELIDIALPWYVNFLTSWRAAESAGVSPLWLTYEEMMADKPATMRRVLDFHDINSDSSAVSAAVERVESRGETRMNQGVSGRGHEQLTDTQMDRIRAPFRHYPGIDFTPVGIEPIPSAAAAGS